MLKIADKIKEEISNHLIQTYPFEGCGFLYGSDINDSEREVLEVKSVDNSKAGDQKRRFEISAKDYMDGERYALENNLSLLGIYHSHPDHPAIPSEHDRVQAMPYFSYVIVSVKKGKIADTTSWRLNEQRKFEAENINSVLGKK